MLAPDYLIVGSGLTGAVIARLLREAGFSTLIVDRRSHMGGNVHDHTHASGIVVHTYGPHYFRTVSDDIWAFVNRFTSFYTYESCIQSHIEGTYENWPIAGSYIRRTVGEKWKPEFQGTPSNFEEAALSLMPRQIYETFVKEYNEKQWGVPARALSAELCKRFDVREDDDPRLTPRAKYQGIPVEGYAVMMQRLIGQTPVLLNFDYLKNRNVIMPKRRTIFTGPIDEFFDFSLGKLTYRGQKRVTEYLPEMDRFQLAAQVNEPLHRGGTHIRTLEWKQMMQPEYASRIRGTVLTREITVTPENPEEYEYPFPDERNRLLYRQYREHAQSVGDVLICGRLGEYKYYDMDHAIGRAMTLGRRLIEGKSIREIFAG